MYLKLRPPTPTTNIHQREFLKVLFGHQRVINTIFNQINHISLDIFLPES